MKKYFWGIIVFLLVLFSIGIRLVDITGAPYNFHSFRQTQTLTTIQDYYANGIDLFMSKVNFVGYPGKLVLEFPLFQAIAAEMWRITGPSIACVRVVNILCGLFSAFLIYLIARKWTKKEPAIAAATIYLLIPTNIVYQRAVLVDPMAILFLLIAVYCYLFLEEKRAAGYVAAILTLTMSALLVALIKPLYFFPLIVLWLFDLPSRKYKKTIPALGVFMLTGVVMFFWMSYARSVNAQNFFSSALTVERHLGMQELLNPTYYQALLMRFSVRHAPGPLLFLFLLSPYFVWREKNRVWLLALYGIIFGYLVFFANINLPHDYYQLILMPFLAILVAWTGWKVLDEINVPALKMVLVSVFICSVVVVSSVTSLTMMENSKSIPVFGAKVKPFLVGNRGLVIYGPLNNALELDHQFNDLAFLAAVDRIGLMRPVVSVDEALSDLQKIKAHFNDNYDEVVFYRLGTIDQVALKRFIQLGLALKHQEADLAVFTVKK